MGILKRLHTSVAGHKGLAEPKSGTWTPFALRRWTMLCFALAYAIIAIILGILAFVSHRHQGLCKANSNDHYLWTYAPTALFTILATLWTQTEYRAKQMQPWRDMAKGPPSEASQNVLLDYVSSWNIMVLLKAMRRCQATVVAAVSASLLLKLLIILSTGLFVLTEVNVREDRSSLILKDHFILHGNLSSKVDQRPAATVIGIFKGGLSLPAGTTMNTAYQQFSSPEDLGQNIISSQAKIETISSSLDCELAELNTGWQSYNETNNNGSTTLVSNRVIYSTSSASCHNSTFMFPIDLPGPDTYYIHCNTSDLQLTSQRLFMKVGSPRSEGSNNATAVICRPTYSFRSAVAENSQGARVRILSNDQSSSQNFPGLDPEELLTALSVSTQNTESLMTPAEGHQWATGVWGLLNMVEPQPSFTAFLDAKVLNSTLQKTWSVFAAQCFNFYLRQAANTHTSGSVMIQEDRLVLRSLSFWLVELSLVVVFALSITMCFLSSNNLVPRDPTSIMGLATILANSRAFMQSLHGTGSAPDEYLEGILQGNQFQTTEDLQEKSSSALSTFAIRSTGNASRGYTPVAQDLRSSPIVRWYHPFSQSLLYRIGVVICLIGLILTLELLLHRSQTRNGLIDVHGSGSYEHFAWTVFPALLMVAVAIVVGLPHSTRKVFSPFVALLKDAANTRVSVLKRPFDTFPTWTRWRDAEVSSISSGLAVLTSAFLTIAISGLFSSEPVQLTKPVTLSQQDWFADRTNASNQSPLQINMILIGNSSFPQTTYETLAISRPDTTHLNRSGTLNILVPSIRGNLNCTNFPRDQITNTTIGEGAYPSSRMLYIGLKNQTCVPRTGDGMYDSFKELSPTNRTSGETSQVTIQLPTSGYYGDLIFTQHFFSHENLPGCPPALGSFGNVRDRQVENKLFTCTPSAERVITNVTFKLPEMELDLSSPPIVDERTAEPFNVTFATGDGMPLTAISSNSGQMIAPVFDPFGSMDNFMQILVYGSRGVAGKDLMSDASGERLFSAINRQYGIAFAQLMNNFRIPASSPTKMNGTIISSNGFRLMQSSISTRILEALLGVILIATIVADLTTRTRRVLPRNPCNIAAVASLLAESKFLDMIPEGSERLSDEALLTKFDGYSFSLGYWKMSHYKAGEQRFGIDIIPADR